MTHEECVRMRRFFVEVHTMSVFVFISAEALLHTLNPAIIFKQGSFAKEAQNG